MSKKALVADTSEAWENGTLGCDPKTAKVASPEVKAQIDDMLGLQAISIRLHKDLIEKFKLIAKINGVGYQPLMRDALARFADSEIKVILTKMANDAASEQKVKAVAPQAAAEPDDRKAA